MSSQQDDMQTTVVDEINNTLLIIEDNPADTTHYLRMLEDVDHGFNHIECVETLRDAELYIQKTPPMCCLLDVNLPDGSALLLLKKNQCSTAKYVSRCGCYRARRYRLGDSNNA